MVKIKKNDNAVKTLQTWCQNFVTTRLRAPPIPLVNQWGQKLGLHKTDIEAVNRSILLRYKIGRKNQ